MGDPQFIYSFSIYLLFLYPALSENLVLKESSVSFRMNQPVVGILHQAVSGFQMVELDLQLRTVYIQDQLTREALLSKLYLAGKWDLL